MEKTAIEKEVWMEVAGGQCWQHTELGLSPCIHCSPKDEESAGTGLS